MKSNSTPKATPTDGWANIEMIDDIPGQTQILKFSLLNKIDEPKYWTSMANAIRRTILADLPNYLPSRDMMNVIESTSMLNPDVLSQRLHLCPVRVEKLIGLDNPQGIMIKANIQNTGSQIRSVYLRDLMVEGFDDPADFWTQPDTLWTRLQPGQGIELTTTLQFGTSYTIDTGFQPCAATRYVFASHEDVLQQMMSKMTFKNEQDKELYRIAHQEQAVWRTKEGHPVEFIFTMESLGAYPVQEIIPTACLILEKRYHKMQVILDRLQEQAQNRPPWSIHDVIRVEKYTGDLQAFDFTISYENETIANHWTQRIRRDKEVQYIGYRIPHPQDHVVIIRIALHKKPDELINYFNDCVEKLKEHASGLEKEWESHRQLWRQRSPLPPVPGWEDWVESHIFEILKQ